MERVLRHSRYTQLKDEKNYWKSTLGQMLSRFGDGIDTIAFSILIYQITGSTMQVAALFAVNGLPNLIFGIISGVVTQHKSEKVIMSICDFGRGLCALLTAVLYLTGWIQGWQLYVITFLNSSFESFRAPATASVTPKILKREKMDAGIAFQTSATKLLEVLGLAAAPALIGLLGLGKAIAIDSAMFMFCGIFSVTLHLPKTESSRKMKFLSSLTDLKQGFFYLTKRKQLVNICVFTCLINIVFIPINVFQVPYVQDYLHGGNSMLSVIGIGSAVGIMVSTLFGPVLKEKLGKKKIFLMSGFFLAIPYFIFVAIIYAIEPVQYIGLAVGNFLMGTGIAISSFIIQTQMFEMVEQEYLSRVSSIMNMFALCIVPIFSSLSGLILQFTELKLMFLGAAFFAVIMYVLNYAFESRNSCGEGEKIYCSSQGRVAKDSTSINLHIRKIEIKDYEAISDMTKQLHDIHVKNRPDIYRKAEKVFGEVDFTDMVKTEKRLVYVAEVDDKVVGYISGGIKDPSKNPILMGHKTMYIDELYVESSCRKKSIGKLLLERLENEGLKYGVERIDLTVWSFNKQALDFYKSCGMEEQRIILEKRQI